MPTIFPSALVLGPGRGWAARSTQPYLALGGWSLSPCSLGRLALAQQLEVLISLMTTWPPGAPSSWTLGGCV